VNDNLKLLGNFSRFEIDDKQAGEIESTDTLAVGPHSPGRSAERIHSTVPFGRPWGGLFYQRRGYDFGDSYKAAVGAGLLPIPLLRRCYSLAGRLPSGFLLMAPTP